MTIVVRKDSPLVNITNVNELANAWSFVNDSTGRIVKQNNEHNGNLNFERFITYNKRGDIDMVVCNYNHLKLQTYDDTYTPADTSSLRRASIVFCDGAITSMSLL